MVHFGHFICSLVDALLKIVINTPGTAGGPGGRDRTLAVKSRKNVRKITFFSSKNQIYPKKIYIFLLYLLVIPKYWGKKYFAHGSFPEVVQKQKTEKKEKRKRDINVSSFFFSDTSDWGGYKNLLPM